MVKLALVACTLGGFWFGLNSWAPVSIWQNGFHVANHMVSWAVVSLGLVGFVAWRKIK